MEYETEKLDFIEIIYLFIQCEFLAAGDESGRVPLIRHALAVLSDSGEEPAERRFPSCAAFKYARTFQHF